MMNEEFCLTEYMITADVCGVDYYAIEGGYFVSDKAKAFTSFTYDACLRIKKDISQDSAITITFTETN